MMNFEKFTIYGRIYFSFLFFLILSLSPSEAQNNNNSNNNNNGYPYANFSPSMAIIIVVLVAALFFMGFFSIYIRHCAENNGTGNSVRNALSMRRRANQAARGLEASVIAMFPTFSYAEVKDHKIGKGALECAVCLNEFEDDETLRLIPKCDHVFHPECIDAWLESHVTCPVCRTNLTPQPGEESFHLPELNNQENNNESPRNDDVTIRVIDDESQQQSEEVEPEMKRNLSFDHTNRPPRAESIRRGRNIFGLGRFRSHSTGHSLAQNSLVQPGENVDRFTLRLPEEIRKEMMNRALLNRTGSCAVGAGLLPRDASSRRGYRTGLGEGSSRGGRSYRRIERPDRSRSDRWIFSKATPFFSRALSIRSPRVMADNGEESTSKSVKAPVKMPSFKCLEPKNVDETGLVSADSNRPPV